MSLSIKKKAIKKTISVVTTIATVVCMSGVASFSVTSLALADVVDGALIKSNATNSDGTPTLSSLDVYIVKLVGTKKFKRLVLNPTVFNSYGHLNWGDIQTVSQSVMDEYTNSGLVRVDTDPDEKVYAMAPDGDVGSKSWVNVSAEKFLSIAGSEDGDSIYTINATDAGSYSAVGDITGSAELEAFYSAGTLPAGATGGDLAVALSSETPASTSIIADAVSANGAQALIDMVKVNVTADSTAATVTSVKVKRTGISSNADLSNVYLYDGATRLAEYNSYSEGIATFTNAAGLFSVDASSTKTITVKVDLANGTTAGKTIGLQVTEMGASGGSSVSGLPVSGNAMTTASVTDLGKLTINAATSYPTNVDPGQTELEVWRFNLVSANQDIEISRLNLTMVGTITSTDLQNIKLLVGGVQIGTTAQIADDNTVLFDFSSTPYVITSGQTKTVTVTADIVGGTSRSFKFTIRKSSDVAVKDSNYGISLKPNQTDTLAVIEPTAGSGTTINNGKLTVTRSSDSPSTNVTQGATGMTLAKFDLKGTGEAIKISTIVVGTALVGGTATNNLNDGKLYIDGSQIGSTLDLDSAATNDASYPTAVSDDAFTVFTLGNTLIIPAGTTKTLSVVADTKTGAVGTLDNTSVQIGVGGIVATGQVSLATIAIGTATGNSLAFATGTITTAENLSMADASSTVPTGVQGTINTKIGSCLVTSGTGEGVSITQFVLKDAVTDDAAGASAGIATLADAFQNLKVMQGDVQVGSTQTTLTDTAAQTYTFSVSPAIEVAAGAQATFDIYADVLSTVLADPLADINASTAPLSLSSVSYSTLLTSTSATDSNVRPLQNIYIAASGTLSVSTDSASPSAVLIAGTGAEMELARFILKETSGAEPVTVTQIVVTDTTGGTTPTVATFSSVKLFVDNVQVGTAMNFGAVANGTATFTGLNLSIPADTTKTLVVKAIPNAYPNGTSASTHNFTLAASAVTAAGAVSNTDVSGPTVAQTSNTHMWSRTSLDLSSTTQGATSSRVRNADDKIATLTFVSGTPSSAALRGALQINDEAIGSWAATDADNTAAVDGTNKVDGTNSIQAVSGANAVAVLAYDTGASSAGLENFSRVSAWVRIVGTAAAGVGDVTFAIDDHALLASPQKEVAVATASTSATWYYVDFALTSMASTSRYVGVKVTAAGAGETVTVNVDNVRFYNDSVTVTLTGNLLASLGSHTKAVNLKDSSGVIKMIGYANTTVQNTAAVTLTVGGDAGSAQSTAGDINVASSGTALNLILSSVDHVLVDVGAAAEAFTTTINLGSATSTGDIRWYDSAVTATTPLTWVNGVTPVQSSVSFQ
jgi:hypothetical protein